MKTNFLKTSLSAFAFALAIVASFAFSPALNSTDEVVAVPGYTQATGAGSDLTPCNASRTDCEPTGITICTVGIGQIPVYQLGGDTGSTTCLEQLFLP